MAGFEWEQVYPGKIGDETLHITGANFELCAPIDFYEGRIGERLGSEEWSSFRLLSARKNPDLKELYYGFPDVTFPLPEYAIASLLLDKSRADAPHLAGDNALWLHDILAAIEGHFPYGPIITFTNPLVELEVINGSLSDCRIDSGGDLFMLYWAPTAFVWLESGGRYPVLRRLGTTLSEGILKTLFAGGVDAMLNTEYQESDSMKEAELPFSLSPEYSYLSHSVNAGKLDFTGPYGVYYREIFFHIPFLIANHLNSQGKFAEAQTWYHYIFDPTSGEVIETDDPKELTKEFTLNPQDRNWRYCEFRGRPVESLRDILIEPGAIETYKQDPFNPHAIARLRLSAYQKAIVMKYIDNLLDWGDSLFAQDTMESINEATLLYVLAADILGERPAELGDCGEGIFEPKERTYKKISAELEKGDPEFLIEMEHLDGKLGVVSSAAKNVTDYTYAPNPVVVFWAGAEAKADDKMHNGRGGSKGIFRSSDWQKAPKYFLNAENLPAFGQKLVQDILVFCVPPNQDLLDYWDRVEDRLFKIRHYMNISGLRRELALFAPEISPMLLVRAKAAGLSLEEVLNAISGNLPPYRFTYLIEKAKAYAAMVQGFGAALLSALEKKDVEELNLLRTIHQQNLLQMATQIRHHEFNAAEEAIQALTRRKETVEHRKGYYESLISTGLISEEVSQSTARHSATGFRMGKEIFDANSGIIALTPQLGSPFSLNFGGDQVSRSFSKWGDYFEAWASIADALAASYGLAAGFIRRQEGWKHQVKLADHEVKEVERQIAAAEIRKAIAEQSLEIHEQSLEQINKVYEFYRDKFSNLGLYTWLSGALQLLFKEAYNNAYALARLAEQAYRFERGDDQAQLIGANHWTASRAGLLAGERLLIDLQNLERRFIETNYRSLEVDQSFSLTQLDPAALIKLKETGTCQFHIPEIFFDLFYPGQYRRKIKSVRLTIPCITGPYTNVSASLSLIGSQIRRDPKLDDGGVSYLLDVAKSRTVSIATSTAQNDAGVFELNFRDERYIPFEGAGAISHWELSLPKNFRQFDYQTINDVIIHISYTAEYDDGLRNNVEGITEDLEHRLIRWLDEDPELDNSLRRAFSLRQEFSNEFHRLLHRPAGEEVPIKLEEKHFPIFLKGKTLVARTAKLVLGTAEGQEIGDFAISISNDDDAEGVSHTLDDFSRDDQMGGLWSTEELGSVTLSGIIGDYTLAIVNTGDLAESSDPSTIDSEKLTDIWPATIRITHDD